MRVVKSHEERKNEILDTAEKLFVTKGYSKTTIKDILQEIDIAKGTFYYYFKSKEEVLDQVIMRIINTDVIIAKKIASDPNISVLDKLFQILLAQRPNKGSLKEKMTEQFHQPDNAELHQKSIVQSILHLAPVITEVIQQGIKEEIFYTDYPQETIEILLAGAQVIFDECMFSWDEKEEITRVHAFTHIMESALGAEKGSFNYIHKILRGEKIE